MSSLSTPRIYPEDAPEKQPTQEEAPLRTCADPLKRALPEAEDMQARKKRAACEHLDHLAGLPSEVNERRHIVFLRRCHEAEEKVEEAAATDEAGAASIQTHSVPATEAASQTLKASIKMASSDSTEAPSAPDIEAQPQSLPTSINCHQEPTQMSSGVLPLSQLPPQHFYRCAFAIVDYEKPSPVGGLPSAPKDRSASLCVDVVHP
ncbi:MAG: hypothetical protein LQ346_002086 [Caloplaca aetnensis]|nr:MAG: hypothetical protein LQ346_002086 [Caloplaca aetnensis]